MDMCVDTIAMQSLQQALSSNRSSFESLTNDVQKNVKYAGNALDGNLYNTVVEETEASCKMIGISLDNVEVLRQYICNLEQHVNEYLSCDYTG